jgi:hypothetical protein
MQFRLSSLFVLTSLIGLYLGVLNLPMFLALPLFGALALMTPAYWVTGAIYARDARQAFFIGGSASGAAPYLVLAYNMAFSFRDPWGLSYQRYEFGETQIANLFFSFIVSLPALLAFCGGWIGLAVYRNLQVRSDNADLPIHFTTPKKRAHPLDREGEQSSP